ncbi:MAG: glycosyltransferase family 4 protein [Steroidobacteraceae bacterium]
MLRHFDQHGGGVRTYTTQLLPALFAVAQNQHFVLLFRNPRLLGTYAAYSQVTEIHVPGSSVLAWDQWHVPAAARRLGIDVLFNPKYSIPLNARCSTAWVCHGLDWYIMPWGSAWLDRMSHRFLVPRYARKADAIITVSDITRQHVIEFLKVPAERVHTVYSAIASVFRTSPSEDEMIQVRRRHALPAKFLLYVGQIYPPKNFTRLVQAYARVGPARGIPLVIAGGTPSILSRHELAVPERLGISEWVHWPGWLTAEELACVYRLATALLLPSLFESFGFPILEAMAAGCPVLTANRYGTQEIAADAALLVDPEQLEDIATGIARLVEDDVLRSQLIGRGRARADQFTMERCAAQTYAVLNGLAPGNSAR